MGLVRVHPHAVLAVAVVGQHRPQQVAQAHGAALVGVRQGHRREARVFDLAALNQAERLCDVVHTHVEHGLDTAFAVPCLQPQVAVHAPGKLLHARGPQKPNARKDNMIRVLKGARRRADGPRRRQQDDVVERVDLVGNLRKRAEERLLQHKQALVDPGGVLGGGDVVLHVKVELGPHAWLNDLVKVPVRRGHARRLRKEGLRRVEPGEALGHAPRRAPMVDGHDKGPLCALAEGLGQ